MIKILKCWRPDHYCIRTYAKQSKEMKYLNVAEKHDAAKTIAGLLSKGTARRREGFSVYNKIFDFDASVKGSNSKMVMTSVSGHLLNLEFLASYRNWRNVSPHSLFEAPIRKVCSEDYQPIKRTLEREIRSCQALIIWTDCDREGENIGFEIIDVCRAIKANIAVYRAIFSEITSTSVHRALQQLKQPDKRSSDAVDVRSELDLRTGAAITRFQTMRLQRLFPEKIADKLISYGSCQIPTLGFVAERYKEVEAFVSEPFWKIKVTHTIDDLTVDFNWARNRLFDQQACEDYLLLCLADPSATVESVTVKPKNKWRPTPLDTVEMEKLGSRKLKLSAKETMTIAEKLYTKGIISYPRTETNQFSKEIDLRSLVEQHTSHSVWGEFAQRVIQWGPNPRNGNKSDQAHPPIHPTKLVTDLNGNEGRVYELICRHFLACVSKDAVGSETVVHINIADEKFTATGLCIYERNYLDVYVYDKWNAKQIHRYEQGQQFDPTEIAMQEGATTAPPLLTEADLIALMEKHGIGTDATHADHINTIKERGYIGVVDRGCLVPGVIGMGLYEGYDAMQLALAKPVLRAEFEADLKKICLGEKDPQAVLRQQIQKYKEAYQQIMDNIAAMDAKIGTRINETPVSNTNATDGNAAPHNLENNPNRLQEIFECPKCSVAPLALRQKKNQSGHFIGCLNYPDCKNVIWLPDECKEPSVLDETCQHCGSGVKLLKLKFQTTYHKSVFTAPFGWYKTCLRCDSLFRNTFNINLGNVKRIGAIVGDTATSTRSNAITPILPTITPSTSLSNSNAGRPQTRNSKKPKNAKTSTKNTGVDTNIRTYFTSASSTRLAQAQSTEEIAAAELSNIPLEEFFASSDDGLEDILLAAETNIATASARAANTNIGRNTVDIAVALDDDGDDDLANYSWGTGQRRGAGNVNITSDATQQMADSELDQSFATLFRTETDLDNYTWGTADRNRSNSEAPAVKRPRLQTERNYNVREEEALAATQNVKCTGCHQLAKEFTVRKDGPNQGRQFYVCPKSNPCKFFQWFDEVPPTANAQINNQNAVQLPAAGWRNSDGFNTSNTDREIVICNCGNPANSLTVRKDGPNKGRPFYACCNRDQTCGFFKWGDEEDNQASTSTGVRSQTTSTWGTGRSEPRDNFSAANKKSNSSCRSSEQRGDNSKSRKCGLCRQEGHTRVKCPRKEEFDLSAFAQ